MLSSSSRTPLRTLAAAGACLALAGTPAAALAQSAGDEQYADPLAGQQQPKPKPPASSDDGGGNAGGGNSGTSTPAATPQSTPTAAQTATTTPTAAPAGQLPHTGMDVGPLVAAGVPLLAAGLALLWLLGPSPRARRRRDPVVLFDGTLPPLR
jgi:hypothetical protein